MTSDNLKNLKCAAVKLKSGKDLLGFFCGNSDPDEELNVPPAIILYRPIEIKLVTYSLHGKPINSYLTDLFFTYGSELVAIPFSEILTHSEASDFFTLFYARSIGDLMANEHDLHDSYIKFFEDSDLRYIMKNTDSIHVESGSEFLQ